VGYIPPQASTHLFATSSRRCTTTLYSIHVTRKLSDLPFNTNPHSSDQLPHLNLHFA
jgi:hypothetical protein